MNEFGSYEYLVRFSRVGDDSRAREMVIWILLAALVGGIKEGLSCCEHVPFWHLFFLLSRS